MAVKKVLTKSEKERRMKFIVVRNATGLSKPEFAERLGLTTRSVYHYESGDRSVSKQLLLHAELLRRTMRKRKKVNA